MKGDDKRKGKKSGKRINRYVELDCNIEDTGIYSYTCVFPIEKQIFENSKKKERKEAYTYSMDQWRNWERVIQLGSVPSEKKNLRG